MFLFLFVGSGLCKVPEPKLEAFVSASTDDLRILCLKEVQLAAAVKQYIHNNGGDKEKTEFEAFRREEQLANISTETCDEYVKHPVHSFHLLKRTTQKWNHLVASFTNSRKLNKIKSVLRGFPEPQDFDYGAHFGLLNVQLYYNIPIKDLMNGRFTNIFTGATLVSKSLTGEDARNVARVAAQVKRFDKQVEWLRTAAELESSQLQLLKIKVELEAAEQNHDHILQIEGYGSSTGAAPDGLPEVPVFTFSHLIGDQKPTQKLDKSLKKHARELESLQLFEDLKPEEIPTQTQYLSKTFKRMWFHNQNTTIQLCQGRSLRSALRDKDTKCQFIHNSDPYLLVGPFKLEHLNLDPPVGIFRDFYSERECDSILKRGQGNIKSTPFQIGRETSFYTSQRVSKRLHLNEQQFQQGLESSKRIGLATKWTVHTEKGASDDYNIINYGIGGQIEIHVDYWNINNKREAGARISTFMGYLSDVESGGRTVFPGLGLSVPPEKGSALFWFTLNNFDDYDSRMFHMGCPVMYGHKWVMTKWMYSDPQMWTQPCSTQKNNFKPFNNFANEHFYNLHHSTNL